MGRSDAVNAFVGFPREVSGLAVIRSLQRRGIGVTAYDCHPGSAGLHVRNLNNRYVVPCPEADESGFVEWLLQAGDEAERPVLIDLEPAALAVIDRHRAAIQERFRLVLPPSQILDIAQDKAKTAQFFAEHGLGAPTTVPVSDESDIEQWQAGFPAVFKPRRGKGGRGQHVVGSVDEALRLWRTAKLSPGAYVLQEWVPGPVQNLCTVGMLCAPGGEPRALFSAQRLDVVQTPRIAEGVTSYVRSVRIPELLDVASRFARASGWMGMAELEFKRDERDKSYKILEINPRIWAWIALPTACGVDFPYYLYRMATTGDCELALSFAEDVKYLRSVLHLYTQLHRLRVGKLRFWQCLREIVAPYLDLFRPNERVVLEDLKFRREYLRWLRFYWKETDL